MNEPLNVPGGLAMSREYEALTAQLAAVEQERDAAESERIEWVQRGERAEAQLAARDARITELEEELEAHAWKHTPAMAQAKIDQLNQQLADRDAEIAEQVRTIARIRTEEIKPLNEQLALARAALERGCIQCGYKEQRIQALREMGA